MRTPSRILPGALLCVALLGDTAWATDPADTTTASSDVLGIVDQTFGLIDKANDTPMADGLAKAGSKFFDVATVLIKTEQASQESGAKAAYVFTRETAATVAGNYTGEQVGAALFAAVVGSWGPTWAVAAGAIAGFGAKKLTSYLVANGMDWMVDGVMQGGNTTQSLEAWKKARALERWVMEIRRSGQPPPSQRDLEVWSRSYENPEEEPPPIGVQGGPLPLGEHQLIGTWHLDRDIMMASAPAIARSIGRDVAEVEGALGRMNLTLHFSENSRMTLEGMAPTGKMRSSGKWGIRGRNIEISEVEGDTIPTLYYEGETIELRQADMQGLRLVFRRRK